MISSASVVLDDIDDYLAPSQACVNPLFQPPDKKLEEEKTLKRKTKIVPRRRRRREPVSDENESLPKTDTTTGSKAETLALEKAAGPAIDIKKDPAVKASIADCLACSGCVTTAETVLLENRHSLQSLQEKLQSSQGRFRAITISPNSWADMCRHWKLYSSSSTNGTTNDGDARDIANIRLQFTTLLNQILRADLVVDGNLPLQWTWLEEAQEFVELYRARRENMEDPGLKDDEDNKSTRGTNPPLPSTAVDATRSTYYYPDGTAKTVDNADDDYEQTSLPLISGSCPATVCLVEKSLPKLVPHLSRTQSPMSMMGSILKKPKQKNLGETAADLWDHWAIMPCHDKKLEASRQDFVFPHPKRSLVDLVITTSECVELIEGFVQLKKKEEGRHNAELTVPSYLMSLPVAKLETISSYLDIPDIPSTEPTYFTTIGSSLNGHNDSVNKNDPRPKGSGPRPKGSWPFAFSSGGHANFIFLYAARELFGCVLDSVEWMAAADADHKSGDNRKRVIKSARLARGQRQHYFKAQLFRLEDGGYSQTPPISSLQSPVLEFSIAHGMQTIQRVLKEMQDVESSPDSSYSKKSVVTMQYLEAMACPHGGCINGGGAISSGKTPEGAIVRETPTETRQRLQSSLRFLEIPPHPSADVLMLNDSSHASHTDANGAPLEIQSSNWRRTRFHVVPEMKHTLGATAGLKVEEIQW